MCAKGSPVRSGAGLRAEIGHDLYRDAKQAFEAFPP
jgi:hypothetical protein